MTSPTEDRLFVAVPLAESAKLLVGGWRQELESSGLRFQKWLHSADYHITLKFIGNTPASTLPELAPLLAGAASSHPPLRLSAAGTGTFGPKDAPSILWAGVQGDLDALQALQRDVEAACASLGFEPEDRPYRPHITLARRYSGGLPWTRELLPAPGDLPSVTWETDKIAVYRTHMGRSPMYERAADFALRG
ncbi:RNA 2',3'-cyclic phosphodiesterase [Paenibacillus sp. FJAT-26967]|uniref:RNA 2',3'-cyclic phosphodiesterase n=1 Tax=Paenibacillus sp. FJAT-26967 TaxID=1729690 RepID=UPI000838317B|nr:RNA 2',3'-cyclic phosphodiesterase [Paenibacillus sp. FJAT-26967]